MKMKKRNLSTCLLILVMKEERKMKVKQLLTNLKRKMMIMIKLNLVKPAHLQKMLTKQMTKQTESKKMTREELEEALRNLPTNKVDQEEDGRTTPIHLRD